MIQWLVEAASSRPEMAPAEWLSASEQARLEGLTVEKRRREWLLGRWTAKRLWQAVEWQRTGVVRPLASLVIERDEMGAPVCVASEDATSSMGVTVSISHCREAAFCAVVEGANGVLGADMEWVEQRPDGFAEEYFTAAELALVAQAGTERDWLVTAIWSAKEAALKAVRLGLTVDSRAVSCLVRPSGDKETKRQGDKGTRRGGWQRFEIEWDEGRLGRRGRPMLGWWRGWGGYVLTVACGLEI